MRTLKSLEEATAKFFDMHWDKSSTVSPMPWISGWPWKGSVPYHDMAGVYALINGEGEVVYIGLGASIGNNTYPEHGISRRLLSHVLRANKNLGNGHYKPQAKWAEVVDIGAVGFPAEYVYLAPALEDFLIRLFKPIRNRSKVNVL